MNTLDNIEDLSRKIERASINYNYQEALTDDLDNITGDLSEVDVLKIILWKLNRYVLVNEPLRASVNDLKRHYSINNAETVLRSLLNCRGVNLPMASAILRFAVPNHLQVIDQRAYRILTGKNLSLPKSVDEKITLYFDYIHLLSEKCRHYNIPFHKSDRILYEIDKAVNSHLSLTGY